MRNVMYRSRVKTLIKKAEQAVLNEATPEEREASVREAIRTLDKAARKGILHPNNAARRKSRLVKKYHQAQPSANSAA